MAAPTPILNNDAHNAAAKSIRAVHVPHAVDVVLLATSDGTATLAAARLNYTFYITFIACSVTTDNAATLTFQDNAGTPVVVAKTKASPGVGQIEYTFGELGTPITEDKGLDLVISAAGLAGRLHLEGYYRRTKVTDKGI